LKRLGELPQQSVKDVQKRRKTNPGVIEGSSDEAGKAGLDENVHRSSTRGRFKVLRFRLHEHGGAVTRIQSTQKDLDDAKNENEWLQKSFKLESVKVRFAYRYPLYTVITMKDSLRARRRGL
jgi:hypothetical protein